MHNLSNRKLLLTISWLIFFLLGLLLRWPYQATGPLNEDASMILGALENIQAHGLSYFFTHGYGTIGRPLPNVIRPFQMLSLYFDHILDLSFSAAYYQNLLLLALGQSLILVTLVNRFSLFTASLSAFLIGASVTASEPVFWLSDRHDLFLLISLGLYTWVFIKKIIYHPNSIFWWSTFILCNMLCFLSNEKGLVVPAILIVGCLLLKLQNKQQDISLKIISKLILISVVCWISYFIYRYQVLGQLSGGYSDSLLLELDLNINNLILILFNLFQSSFRQATESRLLLSLYISFPIILAFFITYVVVQPIAYTKILTALLLSVMMFIISALPTIKYISTPVLVGINATRMFWLPHIVCSILFGILIGQVIEQQNKKLKLIGLLLLLAYLAPLILALKDVTRSYQNAQNYSWQARKAFENYCSCTDYKNPQSAGLHTLVSNINVFTEKLWIEDQLSQQGLPQCTPAQRCHIKFINHGFSVAAIPYRPSQELIEETKTELVSAIRTSDITAKVERLPLRRLLDQRTITISGWAYEKPTVPISKLVLLANKQIVSFVYPHYAKPKILDKTKLIGFKIGLDKHSLTKGSNQLELVALTRASATQKKQTILSTIFENYGD